jgi:hypothetical protein
LALLDDARAQNRGRVVGHLNTTWVGSEAVARALLGEEGGATNSAKDIVAAMRACLERMKP